MDERQGTVENRVMCARTNPVLAWQAPFFPGIPASKARRALWLDCPGSTVADIALPPATNPNPADLAGMDSLIDGRFTDIRGVGEPMRQVSQVRVSGSRYSTRRAVACTERRQRAVADFRDQH